MSTFKVPNPIQWSGKTTAFKGDKNTPSGFRKVWMLDVQWSDCPVEVKERVKVLWRDYECGNDKYVIKADLGMLIENEEYIIVQYILEKCPDLDEEEDIFIYFWW